jgi:hypothetical protein
MGENDRVASTRILGIAISAQRGTADRDIYLGALLLAVDAHVRVSWQECDRDAVYQAISERMALLSGYDRRKQ